MSYLLLNSLHVQDEAGSLKPRRMTADSLRSKRYGNVNFKDLQLSPEDEVADDEDPFGSSPGAKSGATRPMLLSIDCLESMPFVSQALLIAHVSFAIRRASCTRSSSRRC